MFFFSLKGMRFYPRAKICMIIIYVLLAFSSGAQSQNAWVHKCTPRVTLDIKF